MKKIIIAILLLTITLSGKSQIHKPDTLIYLQDKPDTIFLPEGVTSAYDSNLPTISIDPTFMADFAEWSLHNFILRKCCWGRYWRRRNDPGIRQYTDKEVFELFNKHRKKLKP